MRKEDRCGKGNQYKYFYRLERRSKILFSKNIKFRCPKKNSFEISSVIEFTECFHHYLNAEFEPIDTEHCFLM